MITVHITAHELRVIPGQKKLQQEKAATPRDTEEYILHRLRNAGMPIQGLSFLIALARGRLTIRRDMDGGFIYEWRDEL